MNSDIKRLMDNFFSLALLKVFNLLLPLITLPYLLKTLNIENYGVIVLALSLTMYFQTIIEYGFNLSATRDIAKNRNHVIRLQLIYSKVVWCKFLLLFFSLVILAVLVLLVPIFHEEREIFLLTGLILIGHSMFPEWFFRGVEKMRYITLLDLSIKLLFTVGVFIFIENTDDGWLYPLMLGSAYIVISILSHIIIFQKFNVYLVIVKKKMICNSLKKTFPLFVNQFFPNLYNNTTTFLVGVILGNYAVGLFGAIKQVISLLNVFNAVVTTVMFPYLNRNKKSFSHYCRYYLVILFVVSVTFIFIGDYALFYLNIEDNIASIIFCILVFGIFNVGVYSVFATNFLLVYKKDRLVMKITVITSIVGFVFSYPLISYFGLIGAAINVCASQLLLGTLSYICYKKYRKNNFVSV